jgi:hypothetical protein
MLGFVALVGIGASDNRSRSQMPVAEILENLASAANGMKGDQIAANVIVGGATIKDGKRLTYIYRIPQMASGGVDEEVAQQAAKKMKREVCRNRMMRQAVYGGAAFLYSYRNQKGRVVYEVEIDKGDCVKKS